MSKKIDEIRENARCCKKAFAAMGYTTNADDTLRLCDAYVLLETHLEDIATALDEGQDISSMGIDIVLKTADQIIEKGK